MLSGEKNTQYPVSAISHGPLSAHLRSAIQMAFRWWADGGPLLYRLEREWAVFFRSTFYTVLFLGR